MNAVGLKFAAITMPQDSAGVAISVAHDAAPPPGANDPGVPRPPRRSAIALPVHLALGSQQATVDRSGVTLGETTRPASDYRGIAVKVVSDGTGPIFRLTLEHEDPSLSIQLAEGSEVGDVARLWQAWGATLCLPLIAIDADGSIHAELNAIGVVLAERPYARRRGSALVGRRSRYGLKRRAAAVTRPVVAAHCGEREIIARS